MTNSIVRTILSLGIGVTLAISLLTVGRLMQAPNVHAQLDSQDILGGNDFADSTGLSQSDLKESIGGIIQVMLGFLGIIAIVIVLLGGFKWMTAGGNDERVDESKKLMISGVIGMAIILSAWAITSFVVESLVSATQ